MYGPGKGYQLKFDNNGRVNTAKQYYSVTATKKQSVKSSLTKTAFRHHDRKVGALYIGG